MSLTKLQDCCSTVCRNVWKSVWFVGVCVCVYKKGLVSVEAGSIRTLLFNVWPHSRVGVGKGFRSEYLFCSYLIWWKSAFGIWTDIFCFVMRVNKMDMMNIVWKRNQTLVVFSPSNALLWYCTTINTPWTYFHFATTNVIVLFVIDQHTVES